MEESDEPSSVPVPRVLREHSLKGDMLLISSSPFNSGREILAGFISLLLEHDADDKIGKLMNFEPSRIWS